MLSNHQVWQERERERTMTGKAREVPVEEMGLLHVVHHSMNPDLLYSKKSEKMIKGKLTRFSVTKCVDVLICFCQQMLKKDGDACLFLACSCQLQSPSTGIFAS